MLHEIAKLRNSYEKMRKYAVQTNALMGDREN